jgi:hypothetical protein
VITYVDSSVVLRILFDEPEPLGQWSELEPVSSDLMRVECFRAIERLRATMSIDDVAVSERRAGALKIMAAFGLAVVSDSILDRAAEPFPIYVATLDAIHLATAIAIREDQPDLLFATHDQKLGWAAQSVGFQVLGV